MALNSGAFSGPSHGLAPTLRLVSVFGPFQRSRFHVSLSDRSYTALFASTACRASQRSVARSYLSFGPSVVDCPSLGVALSTALLASWRLQACSSLFEAVFGCTRLSPAGSKPKFGFWFLTPELSVTNAHSSVFPRLATHTLKTD